MATKYYIGVDGDWSVGANWGGAIPADTDIAIIPNTNLTAITSGLTQSGIRPALIQIDQGHNQVIGGPGDPLLIDAVELRHNGHGSLYYQSEDDGTTEFTGLFVVDSSNRTLAAQIGGDKVDRIVVLAGAVDLLGSLGTVALPSLVEVGSKNPRSTPAILTNACGVLAGTGVMRVLSGQVISTAAIPILDMFNGYLTHANGTIITTITAHGGRIDYGSTGTIVTINLYGGIVDLRVNALAKTITTLNLHPGGELIRDKNLTTITTINDFGGRLTHMSSSSPSKFGGAPPAIPV